jgi:hypothetical protein
MSRGRSGERRSLLGWAPRNDDPAGGAPSEVSLPFILHTSRNILDMSRFVPNASICYRGQQQY